MVVVGTPCDDNASTVSTGDVKIDYVARKSYHFKTILDDCLKMNSVNNLPVFAAASENVMIVDTGAAVTFSKV